MMMVFGTADAAKWVKRREYCLTQPRATINTSRTAGPCGRPATEAAERRRGPLPIFETKKSLVGHSGLLFSYIMFRK
jgi:hypothetical protein